MSTTIVTNVLDAAGQVYMIAGDGAPTAGSGVAAGLGSIYTDRTTGTLYTKTGSGATAWTAVGGSPSTYRFQIGPWSASGIAGTATTQAQLDSFSDASFVANRAGTVTGGGVIIGPGTRTAGTLDAFWYKNGVQQVSLGQINGVNTSKNWTTGLSGAYAAGDLITIKIVTSAFTPAGTQNVDAWIELLQ
jgi:hypothetical protein